ncbi:MAG: HAD-IIA family hydrolase [Anaerolineales bacterium]|nr:HAD-IIA family hydrolase [Anaerolineales bacterium]
MLKNIRALILDMDGVLWRQDAPIGDLPAIFDRIRACNLKVALATNNATKTVAMFQDKLSTFGVVLEDWQIVSSAMAVADLLQKRYPDGGEVFTIGETGLIDALKERGFTPISDDAVRQPVAVAAGLDRTINYAKLRTATLLIRNQGVPFYASNSDRSFPTPEGQVPGAGAILASIVAATDVEPIIAGKPKPTLFELCLDRLGTSAKETLMVGDRLETDIAGAQAVGMPTAVVLSGISTVEMAKAWRPKVDLIAEDLECLLTLASKDNSFCG